MFLMGLASLLRRESDLQSFGAAKLNFENLMEHVPGLACIVDSNKKLVRWNSRLQDVLGYSAAELREMPAVQGLAEDYRDLVPAVMGQAWETGHAAMEAAWLSKSGVRIPCYMTGVRILVGNQPCILSVGIDISDKKRAEDALRQSEEQYRRLLTNLPDVAWTSNLNGEITYVSPNVQDIFGRTPQQVCDGGTAALIQRIHPDDRESVEVNYRKLFEENEVFDVEYRLQRRDGEWRWVHDRAIRTHQQNGVLFADGVLSDITERKQAEEDLRKGQEQYRRLLTNLPDVTWTMDAERRFTYISPNVQNVFGFTPAEAFAAGPELRLSHIYPDDLNAVEDNYRALFLEGRTFDLEYRMLRKDGRWIWVRNRALRTFQQDGKLFADGMLSDVTERKQAERIDSQLASIVMSSGDAIIGGTADGTIVSWNPAAEQMYGYPAGEVIGKHVSMLVPPERMYEMPEVFGKVARGEQIQRFETVRVRKDGTWFDVSLTISVIKDRNGRVLGISTIAHDISLRKQAEENLRKSEEQYRRLLGNLPDVTWTASLKGDVSYLSSNVEQVIGYTSQEFLEQGSQLWFALIHPDDRARVQEKRRALFETGETFDIECRAQHKDGRWIWVRDRALRTFSQDGKLFADGILSDITQRKAAETTNSQLASIVNSSRGAIIGKTSDGTIVSWNPAAQKMFGYSTNEAIGKHISMLIPPERLHEMPDILGRIAHGEQVERFDSVCLRKDGSRVDVSLAISPITDGRGTVLGISTIANDISLRKRAEQELMRAKEAAEAAARAKTQFLANISHELRTPMNGILGMAELALDTQLDAEQRESLLVIQSSGSALLRLIDDLLDFTRTESGTLALDSIAFNLHETVRQTLRPLHFQAQQVGLGFQCQIDSQLPDMVLGDPQRLRQVLVNVVGNAIKFTQQGKVVLHVSCNSLNAGRAEVLFKISDTGIGVPPEKHAAIFEGFTQSDGSSTRKYGGTGLGLAISSHLVELMNGKIWVESRLGQGSTFCFTIQLPVSENSRRAFHPEPAETAF
ncbi:MAG: PAS domain S-box protein [Candidatus Korobacteraceae bacterium]